MILFIYLYLFDFIDNFIEFIRCATALLWFPAASRLHHIGLRQPPAPSGGKGCQGSPLSALAVMAHPLYRLLRTRLPSGGARPTQGQSLADALMAFPIALYMALYASAPATSPGTHIRQLRSKRRRSGIHRHGNREALMCSDILASITGRQGSGLGQRGGRHLGHQRLLRLFCGRLAACGSQRIPGIGLLPIR